eukprot:GHVR01141910.1.p1 GENE.GHVR01141910.1~~GHVR01141910.1.p1  ORF type:complete len:255 (-),score=100.65 GHVR01141910.1:326-1090(-)
MVDYSPISGGKRISVEAASRWLYSDRDVCPLVFAIHNNAYLPECVMRVKAFILHVCSVIDMCVCWTTNVKTNKVSVSLASLFTCDQLRSAIEVCTKHSSGIFPRPDTDQFTSGPMSGHVSGHVRGGGDVPPPPYSHTAFGTFVWCACGGKEVTPAVVKRVVVALAAYIEAAHTQPLTPRRLGDIPLMITLLYAHTHTHTHTHTHEQAVGCPPLSDAAKESLTHLVSTSLTISECVPLYLWLCASIKGVLPDWTA